MSLQPRRDRPVPPPCRETDFEAEAGIMPTKKTFCRTYYEGNKGKDTYFGLKTEDLRCIIKLTLNTIVDTILPEEVLLDQEIRIRERFVETQAQNIT